MKKMVFLLVLSIFCFSTVLVQAESWQKFVSEDGSLSFHYPKGWNIKAERSQIEISNPPKDEQILFMALPYDARKSPADHGKDMISLIRQEMPDFKASNWAIPKEGKDMVTHFEVTYTDKGKKYLGNVVVMKVPEQAFWFSFTGPSTGYSGERAVSILEALIASISSGPDSQHPTAQTPDDRYASSPSKTSLDRIEKAAQAFLFCLEFSLGAPLTASQEKLILAELRKGWKTASEEELQKYDEYPKLVALILSLKQNEIETFRKESEKILRQALAESDKSDPGIAVINAQLQKKSKVLIAGNPPLTEMAATAYSEMFAYSELLHKYPNATPDQMSSQTVAEIQKQLLKEWSRFTKNERERIAAAPGLWVATRALLRYSSKEEQGQIKSKLLMLTAQPQPQQTQVPIQQGAQKNIAQKGSKRIGCEEYLQMSDDQKEKFLDSGGPNNWTKEESDRCIEKQRMRHQQYMAVSTMMYNSHLYNMAAIGNMVEGRRYEVVPR